MFYAVFEFFYINLNESEVIYFTNEATNSHLPNNYRTIYLIFRIRSTDQDQRTASVAQVISAFGAIVGH